ncbi:hypothetical protein ACJZ2D_013179 [Fusarium nematophilum]
MSDRAQCMLHPMEDDWAFSTSYISQPLPWQQWCPIDQLGPFGSSPDETSTTNSVFYPPNGPSPPNTFVYPGDTGSIDLWSDNSPMTEDTNQWSGLIPVQEILPSFFLSEPVVATESLPLQDNCHQSPTPQKASGKQNSDTSSPPLRKSDRQRLLSNKSTKPPGKEETQYSTIRRNRGARGNSAYAVQQSGSEMKSVRERNRIAATKFRTKQRQGLQHLESIEQDLERIHRDLSASVTDLTLEVYNLKMELLQHSGCNCTLIQNYLVQESQRYVQVLQEATPRDATGSPPGQCGQRQRV